MKKKLFYVHIPKTAGTSINSHYCDNFDKYFLHLEGTEYNKEFVGQYGFVSGHLTFPNAQKVLNDDFMTMVTLREPYSYAVSHLSWIRKLADKGEEKRFLSHPKIFQKIALKMKEFDFSDAKNITAFINWLDETKFRYLHNTQTLYLDDKKRVSVAKENLKKINFVGVTDQVDEFTQMVSDCFGFPTNKATPEANRNNNKYGFDLNCDLTRKALEPLIENDKQVYTAAKEIFENDFCYYEDVKSLGGDFRLKFLAKTIKPTVSAKKKSVSKKGQINKSFEGSCSFSNPASIPSVVKPKRAFGINVILTNNSSSTWTSEGGQINWAYHWLNEQGTEVVIFEGHRTPIENIQLKPNSRISGRMAVMAPAKEGRYILKIVPMKTGIAWFDKYDFSSATLLVTVSNKD